jgi:hypothetical protein
MIPTEPTFPKSIFHIPWIAYLSAPLATGLGLPPEIQTEGISDGGLLMIAAEERLDPDLPEHARRARILAETLIARTATSKPKSNRNSWECAQAPQPLSQFQYGPRRKHVQHQQLRDDWLAHLRNASVDPVPRFAEQGIILGAGTVLLACDSGGRRLQQEKGQEARLVALLSAACGEVLPGRVAGNIERAAKCWNEGDYCLAYIHLAHASLPVPRDAHASACRLLVAERAMTAGVAPQIILQALRARIPDADLVAKFDPNEPRVPAGSGPTSGQWTNSDGTSGDGGATDATGGEGAAEQGTQGSSVLARMPLPASSFLGDLGVIQAAELGGYVLRLLGPVGAAAAAFGLLFIPSPNDVHSDGEVLGVPGLRYSWNRDEALFNFSYETSDGEQRTFAAYVDGDKLYDEQGRVIGRVLSDGGFLIESAVALPALAKDDEPRLCPIPGRDKPNELGRAYENYVKLFVNPPPNTTPSGIGFQLPNPQESGKLVNYDDCRLTTGMMADAKGPGYEGLLSASNSTFVPEWTSVIREWWSESGRQIAASDGRPVRWYFADLAVARFARQLFDSDDSDGRQRIEVVFLPWSTRANNE